MTLDKKLTSLIKEAMLAKNDVELRTLRAIKSAFTAAKTEKGAEGTLSDEQEIKIIQKLYKQSKDSMALYQSQNREDLASKEKEEMDIIESFLPKQINDDELNSALTLIIEQVNAKSMADMGKVMGIASKSLAGKAEGARIAAQLKKLLS